MSGPALQSFDLKNGLLNQISATIISCLHDLSMCCRSLTQFALLVCISFHYEEVLHNVLINSEREFSEIVTR